MNVATLTMHHMDNNSTLAEVVVDMVVDCEHSAVPLNFLSVNCDCDVHAMYFGCRIRSNLIDFPAMLPSLYQCNWQRASPVQVHFEPFERDEVVVLILVFDAPTLDVAAVATAFVGHNLYDANVADNMNLVDIGTVCIAIVVHADTGPFVAFPRVWHATMAIPVHNAPVTFAIGWYSHFAVLEMSDHVSLPAAPTIDHWNTLFAVRKSSMNVPLD